MRLSTLERLESVIIDLVVIALHKDCNDDS